MTDILPDIRGGAGRTIEATPVMEVNQNGGKLQSTALQSQALNVAAVGDLVIFFGHNAGSYTAFVSGQYSSSPL